jgi:hypothetical protein
VFPLRCIYVFGLSPPHDDSCVFSFVISQFRCASSFRFTPRQSLYYPMNLGRTIVVLIILNFFVNFPFAQVRIQLKNSRVFYFVVICFFRLFIQTKPNLYSANCFSISLLICIFACRHWRWCAWSSFASFLW